MKLDIEVRMGGRRFLQLMDCANNCVSEVEDDWARVWHWLGLRGHFQLQLNRMGFPLHEVRASREIDSRWTGEDL